VKKSPSSDVRQGREECHPIIWEKNLKKYKRATEQEYLNKYMTVPAQKIEPPCRCRLHCNSKLANDLKGNCLKCLMTWLIKKHKISTADYY
jgi:hypothetical protein